MRHSLILTIALLIVSLAILSCESVLGILPFTELSIESHPEDQYVVQHMTATFEVDASGNDLSYQWYNSDGALTNKTDSKLEFTGFTKSDSGSLYWCVVYGSDDTLTSNSTMLHVLDKISLPIVSVPQKSFTVSAGDAVVMRVEASGVQLLYQWKKGEFPIFGATQSEYAISSVTSANNGDRYSCVVSNSMGSVSSDEIFLTVQ